MTGISILVSFVESVTGISRDFLGATLDGHVNFDTVSVLEINRVFVGMEVTSQSIIVSPDTT